MKPEKELNKFQLFVHKFTGQSLKLGKIMTDRVANTFGHVRWPSVISTPGLEETAYQERGWDVIS